MDNAKTVLLTGSRGFTGQHVWRALKEAGYQVIGLVQSAPGLDEVAADLEDVAALRKAVSEVCPDYVIHLAAIAFVAHADLVELYRVNLFGTMNLLQALHDEQVPVSKVLLASSANIYGAEPICPVSESCVPAPVNHYAMSKLAMEHMARTWLDKLPIVITRPFNYTGPGQDEKFLIPKIVNHFLRKEPKIRLGNIDVEREFNDVRMVSHAYLRLMEAASSGSVVNICTGVGHRLEDVLLTMSDLTNHKLDIEIDSTLVRNNELKVLVGNPEVLIKFVPDLPKYSLVDTLNSMLLAGLG